MKKIKLSGVHGKGRSVIVDDIDYEKLSKHRWHASGGKTKWIYAARRVWKNKKLLFVLLHREVMGFPEKMFVDHINGNTLDNRRKNLRIVTPAENSMNSKRLRKNPKLHCITVRAKGKYILQTTIKGKSKYLGLFSTIKEARAHYNQFIKSNPLSQESK